MIRRAEEKDYLIVAKLAKELWPHALLKDLENEFLKNLSSKAVEIFLDFTDDIPIGFAQVSLRYDYVEGATTSPVAYLEGIYVKESHRNKNVAHELVKGCEFWAKEQGCKEFASDCELENEIGYRFHLKNDFMEVNKIICFLKKLF